MANLHVRSNSLPSRPHPLILKCNENLETLASSSLLSHKLGGLQDLIECVEQLVQLPLTQGALLHNRQESWVLDGSLRLLDACTAAKDALLHTKEYARELQSIMRRKRGSGELDLMTAEVKKFLSSRKVVRKAISKALTNLKGATRNYNISSSSTMIGLLQEVEVAAISTFQTIMQFISGTTTQSKWISISKVIQTKNQTACAQVEEESEFAQVDVALQSFVFSKSSSRKSEEVNNLKNQLEKMEMRIQDLEEGLEFLFRRLIKIRVSLLNILNH